MSAYRSQVADKATNIPKLEIRVKTCSCTGDLQPHRRPAAQQFQVASSHMTLPSLGLVRCAKVEQGRILCDGLGIISNCLVTLAIRLQRHSKFVLVVQRRLQANASLVLTNRTRWIPLVIDKSTNRRSLCRCQTKVIVGCVNKVRPRRTPQPGRQHPSHTSQW